MKRNPPLLDVLAAGVELAALGIGAWVMGWHTGPSLADGTLGSLEPSGLAGPRLVAPPPSGQAPPFLTEGADETRRLLRGYVGGNWVTFGFYSGDAVRFVDADGACYEGQTVNAVAVMHERDGIRSFALQISVSPEAHLQATFLGGAYDAETLELEPLVERPVA